MHLSIIICTYNRDKIIIDSITSFYSMRYSEAIEFELIIVDNNSSDNTRSVVQELSAQHDTLLYVFEPIQGLSQARNRGIQEAKGNIIVFVDDDVYFSNNWLTDIIAAFDEPSVECVGGNIIPVFDAGKPEWLENPSLAIFGSTNFGSESRRLRLPDHPFGGNMAFRRSVFDVIGVFDTALGRKKDSLLSSEETELFYRIQKNNIPVWFTPNATIYHRIPNERAQKDWIYKRYYWQGISDVACTQMTSPINKLTLLKNTLRNTSSILKLARGSHLTPRKIYWHYKNLPLEQGIHLHTMMGNIRQSLHEIFR
ncbi:MAG: glycosyltransferase [Porticoccaceae bacterium]|nr:glycosyltransferase [Porticoccaceae bacterium]